MEENCGKTCRFCESSGESDCVSISIGVWGDVTGQGGGANPKTTPTIPSRLVGFAVSLKPKLTTPVFSFKNSATV